MSNENNFKEKKEKFIDLLKLNFIDNTNSFKEPIFKYKTQSEQPTGKLESDEPFGEETSDIEKSATGVIDITKRKKIIEYPFSPYIVKIVLTEDNEFLGIKEIKVDKDFQRLENKLRNIKVHNIEEFNIEE